MEALVPDADLSSYLISCPVCRDTYNLTDRYPIIIPCGHTFCKQCAQTLSAPNVFHIALIEQSLSCPVCRMKHKGKGNHRDTPFGMPKNLQLLSVVEKVLEESIKIDNAKARLEKVKCRDCKEEFTLDSCVKCDCFTGEDSDETDLLERDMKKLICMECVNKSHRNHHREKIYQVKMKFGSRETAKNLLNVMERIQAKAESAAKDLHSMAGDLDKIVESIKTVKNNMGRISESQFLYQYKSKCFTELENLEKNVSKVSDAASDGLIFGRHKEFLQKIVKTHTPGHPNVVFLDEPAPADQAIVVDDTEAPVVEIEVDEEEEPEERDLNRERRFGVDEDEMAAFFDEHRRQLMGFRRNGMPVDEFEVLDELEERRNELWEAIRERQGRRRDQIAREEQERQARLRLARERENHPDRWRDELLGEEHGVAFGLNPDQIAAINEHIERRHEQQEEFRQWQREQQERENAEYLRNRPPPAQRIQPVRRNAARGRNAGNGGRRRGGAARRRPRNH